MTKQPGYENSFTPQKDLDEFENKAVKQRQLWDPIWQEIDTNFFAYQYSFGDRNTGDMQAKASFDRKSPLPETVLNNSTAMATSYVVPSTESGLRIEFNDKKLQNDIALNTILKDAGDMVIDQLHQTGANNNTLYQSLYPAILSLLCFGNCAVMLDHRVDSTEPIISVLDIRELYLICDRRTSVIHTIFRKTYDKDLQVDKMEVWRDLSYRQQHIPIVINNKATYPISYRVYYDQRLQEEQSRFFAEMPIRYGRLFVPAGHFYGHGLGQRALIAVKHYHLAWNRYLTLMDRVTGTPLWKDTQRFKGPLKLDFDAINEVQSSVDSTGPPVGPMMVVHPAAFQVLNEFMARKEAEIRDALMEKELMIPGDTLDKMTATAVNFYSDQKNSLIAPALVGLTSAVLHGMARIQLYRLMEMGRIDFDKVGGKANIKDLQFSFLSKQDMMRKRVEANIELQILQSILGLDQASPGLKDLFLIEDMTMDMARNQGLSEARIRPEDGPNGRNALAEKRLQADARARLEMQASQSRG